MEYKKISDRCSVSGQVAPEDMAAIRAAGFTTIVCNRPDGEGPGQPSSDAVRAAAEAAGLAYHYNPVSPGALTAEHVAEQARVIAGSAGPVLAHCASGKRATMLWALANPEAMDADERMDRAGKAGHDLSDIRHRL